MSPTQSTQQPQSSTSQTAHPGISGCLESKSISWSNNWGSRGAYQSPPSGCPRAPGNPAWLAVPNGGSPTPCTANLPRPQLCDGGCLEPQRPCGVLVPTAPLMPWVPRGQAISRYRLPWRAGIRFCLATVLCPRLSPADALRDLSGACDVEGLGSRKAGRHLVGKITARFTLERPSPRRGMPLRQRDPQCPRVTATEYLSQSKARRAGVGRWDGQVARPDRGSQHTFPGPACLRRSRRGLRLRRECRAWGREGSLARAFGPEDQRGWEGIGRACAQPGLG